MIKDKIVDAKLNSKKPVAHGVGRRKSAVARVWLTHGVGRIVVNGKIARDYFDTAEDRQTIEVPFVVGALTGQFNVKVNVQGGGKTGQADAVKLGIAHALVELNSALRETFRPERLLTTDSRLKERKKYGQRGARRGFQFVKR